MREAGRLTGANAALCNNLCEFPAMFAKCILIGVADDFHTATGTLVNFGQGPLVVTCAHVLDEYSERWKSGKALIRVGDVRISSSQLAAFDKDLDLATIRLSDRQAADLVSEDRIATQFYEPPRWPLDRAKEGEWVAVGGYPGQWRRQRPEARELVLAYYGIGATPVTSVSERQFGCQFEREHWTWISRDAELPDLTALGGLSGGPVFAERHLHRSLVGIVSDFRENWDIMLMAHTHWLSRDGSIRSDRPWLALR